MFRNFDLEYSVRAVYLVLMKTDPPLEHSQDLISQVSEGESSNAGLRGQSRIKKMARGRHEGIGPIDISKFRLPDVMSADSRYVSRVTKSIMGFFSTCET